MEKAVDIAKTLFIVSSKSGGTTEPNAMKDYFYDRVAKAIGRDKAGHRFIAVTDPGSSLEKVAAKQAFARVFYGEPSIGGRYSVLSPFGLVPAAAAGIDVRALVTNALSMVRSCGADVPPHGSRAADFSRCLRAGAEYPSDSDGRGRSGRKRRAL